MRILYIGTFNNVQANFEKSFNSYQFQEKMTCDYLLDAKLKEIPNESRYDIVFIDENYAMFHQIQKIRSINPSCHLVFLTKNKDLAMKPLIQEPVSVLHNNDPHDQIQLIFRQKKSLVAIVIEDEPIYLDDILYSCVAGHDLTIYCWHNRTYRIHFSIKGIVREINHPDFIQIEKALAVNIKYVQSFQHDDLTMTDGTVFHVGKTFIKQLRKRMANHPKIQVYKRTVYTDKLNKTQI